jgi:hypothetical protein
MHKRTYLFVALLILGTWLLSVQSALAWTATIHAAGFDFDEGGTYIYDVVFGVDNNVEFPVVENPGAPPGVYTVKMDLMNLPGNNPPVDYALLLQDVRAVGEATYMWILQIDPNGIVVSVPPPPPPVPVPLASTISWDPVEFGSGNFEMRDGFDGTGPVVVADMIATTSYDVPAGTDNTWFTIHYTGIACGDDVREGTEACDDGAANGTATSCCKADCTFESAATPCDDGLFCTTDETCDGAGVCDDGTVTECSDGVDCTDDSCDEDDDICVNDANDANCADNQVCDDSAGCTDDGGGDGDDSIGGDGCFIETLSSGFKKNK